MKIIIKEWIKHPKALMLMVLYVLITSIYLVANARMLIAISYALSDVEHVRENLISIGILAGIQTVCSMLMGYVRPIAKYNKMTASNNKYIDKILDADVNLYTRYSCAHVNSVGQFVWSITSVMDGVISFILNIIRIIISLASMYWIAGKLVIPVLVIYILGIGFTKFLYRYYNAINKRIKEIIKKRSQEIENIIHGFSEIRTFNTREWHRERFHNFSNEIFMESCKRAKVNSIIHAAIEGTDAIGVLFVAAYVINQLAAGNIEQAAAMSIIMFIFKIIDPLLMMIDFIDELSEMLALSHDYQEIMDYKNITKDDGDIQFGRKSFSDKIEFNNIGFSYDKSDSVLRNLNISIPKGKKIGICGESGSGKSTIFKLINRFYDPISGSIKIDGIDIKDITNNSYRALIGSVQQENHIFPGTIEENITYGSINYTEHELIEASKKAHLYEFIMDLPDKFKTDVGPNGLKLSGGQKQRIALARLFMLNVDIILLDEATSALDNESEKEVQRSIDNLGKDKTVISIAHRLTTLRKCDVIYLLGKEGIIESGSHKELMEMDGRYAELYNASISED